MNFALAIFVKTPGLTPVKTRLSATIGRDSAEQFHVLAAEAVSAVARTMGDSLQTYWAVAEHAGLNHPLWMSLPRIWQGTGSLGSRLHHVYSYLRRHYDAVLLVGADVPQINARLLKEAITTLGQRPGSCVIGDAADGGFWLFGGNSTVSAKVWKSVPYSQPYTRRMLIEALGRARVHHLQELTDADSACDLAAVRHALDTLPDAVPEQTRLSNWLRDVCD